MIQQITKGIRITVKTRFHGTVNRDHRLLFAFRYRITIENQGHDTVQFNSRWWQLKEILNEVSIISSKGIDGKKVVLKPGESHVYNGRCLLASPFGLMHGHFNLVNFSSTTRFKVFIPKFRLSVPFALN